MENRTLVLDLVEWIAKKPRSYKEVMEAWQTTCPQLTVWEDVVDDRLVTRELGDGGHPIVRVTEKGNSFIKSENRS